MKARDAVTAKHYSALAHQAETHTTTDEVFTARVLPQVRPQKPNFSQDL
jgi:hypothetical protein